MSATRTSARRALVAMARATPPPALERADMLRVNTPVRVTLAGQATTVPRRWMSALPRRVQTQELALVALPRTPAPARLGTWDLNARGISALATPAKTPPRACRTQTLMAGINQAQLRRTHTSATVSRASAATLARSFCALRTRVKTMARASLIRGLRSPQTVALGVSVSRDSKGRGVGACATRPLATVASAMRLRARMSARVRKGSLGQTARSASTRAL